MKFEEKAQLFGLLAFGVLVIFVAYKIEQYKFRDCKKVGHTSLYCFLNMGK